LALFLGIVGLPFSLWYSDAIVASTAQTAATSGVNGTAAPAFPTASPVESWIGLVSLVFLLVFLLPALAVAVRRLHDCDRSGWFYLLAFVPFGGLVLLVFFAQEGTPGPNRYTLSFPSGGNQAQATWG
jgi:uncharacterized membrane protein YhaH (DUF805 family)